MERSLCHKSGFLEEIRLFDRFPKQDYRSREGSVWNAPWRAQPAIGRRSPLVRPACPVACLASPAAGMTSPGLGLARPMSCLASRMPCLAGQAAGLARQAIRRASPMACLANQATRLASPVIRQTCRITEKATYFELNTLFFEHVPCKPSHEDARNAAKMPFATIGHFALFPTRHRPGGGHRKHLYRRAFPQMDCWQRAWRHHSGGRNHRRHRGYPATREPRGQAPRQIDPIFQKVCRRRGRYL
uniref:Uncharacterized protein n=1 Tax=Candidatus Kentrum eta TaxID=2126337 RepID=A0A450URD1_9GAMM|nr:MAG: hypothetical protein BECKH772A_GA0070896_100812 [Candidatus Kentron sp. H]VFJ95753.1 MAG: hypothetical protein BECKH772B_GA0070898_100812 [Candidatus Kentron sp. H]VFK01965.1 MAG: hypothetical protein BECKH772C_GA0070978_100782 [Candidatus Kentron sp. H]